MRSLLPTAIAVVSFMLTGCRLTGTDLRPGIEAAGPNRFHALQVAGPSRVGDIEVAIESAKYEVEKTVVGDRRQKLHVVLRLTNLGSTPWSLDPYDRTTQLKLLLDGVALESEFSMNPKSQGHADSWTRDTDAQTYTLAPGRSGWSILQFGVGRDIRSARIAIDWMNVRIPITP